MIQVIKIFNVNFHNLTMEELISELNTILQDTNQQKIITMALSNPEFIIEAKNNEKLLNYLNGVDFNLADGIGVVKASSLFGSTLKERITGTDLLPRLIKFSADKNYSIFFLGGKPGVAERARDFFLKEEPNAHIVGVHDGYFNDDKILLEKINSLKPDFLMVCLGNPMQEEWIEKNINKLNVKVVFGNGGALDFYSGNVRRAPAWMINNHLEWLFRLFQDFTWKRIKRQSKLFIFIYMYLKQLLHNKIK